MIYDRPYMREDYRRREISVLAWIIIATIGVFIVQNIVSGPGRVGGLSAMDRYLGLSASTLKQGYVWTLVTYGFLHGGLLHILFNMLGVYFLGREVLQLIGSQRFLAVYFGALIVGGLVSVGVQVITGSTITVVGASGALLALLVVYASFQPDRPITLLLFLVVPVTLRPRYIVWGAAAISAFFMLLYEIPGRGATAHSAHLGGMLAGWLYFRYLHERTGNYGSLRPSIELPTWLKKRRPPVSAKARVNVTPPTDLKEEVDRILDKINSQGFGALNEEERRLLDSAREMLSRR